MIDILKAVEAAGDFNKLIEVDYKFEDNSTDPCSTRNGICDLESYLGKEGERLVPDTPDFESIQSIYDVAKNNFRFINCCADRFDEQWLIKNIERRAAAGNTYQILSFLTNEIGDEYMDFFCELARKGFRIEPSIDFLEKRFEVKVSWG